MKNEHGFSLIELIIVVAIMGVVMGVVGVSFSMLGHQKAKNASKSVYNMLGSAQTVGMSKDNCYVALMCDASGNKSVALIYGGKTGTDYRIVEEKSIANIVEVSFVINDGVANTTYNLGNSNNGTTRQGVIIKINRSTGAFDKTYIYTGDIATSISGGVTGNCTDIVIKQNTGQYDIGLSNVTGKFYYK